MSSPNQTLCAAFWNHTNIRSGNRIFPCCRFKHPVDSFTGSTQDILYSDAYHDLRTKAMAGVHINGCEKCYLEEELGKQSLRQEFNQQYTTTRVALKYLEIGFDNICNLTCDGCWEEFSSSWAKLKNPTGDKRTHIIGIDEIQDIPEDLEKVVFLGGEPLMTNRHRKFLSRVRDLAALTVIYHTNGTFLLDHRSISLLKCCRRVSFILSIDGVGALNDRVRSGSSWQDIMRFMDQVTDLGFDLSIHSVIHINNWHGFQDLSAFVQQTGLEWSIGVLTYPDHLSIEHLNDSDKKSLISIMDQHWPNREFITNFLIHENTVSKRKIYKLENMSR